MHRIVRIAAAAWGLAACGGSPSGDPDARPPADGGGDRLDAALPPWPRELPPASELGARRGLEIARAIIHAHSPLSHDACDDAGWVDGVVDTSCLANLRRAVCETRVDALMLTDHSTHISEVPFDALFWQETGDEPVRDADGRLVASRITCPDGHRTSITVGNEDRLMSLGLARHVAPGASAEALDDAYETDGDAAVAALRDAGALVFVPHTESRPLDYLRDLRADGLEIYNLHSNLDADIRAEVFGLEPFGYAADLVPFLRRAPTPIPDLLFFAFFLESWPDLERWDTLASEGQVVPGIGASDVHENVFAEELADGERGDGYRRVMRWFSNHLLVRTRDEAGHREALAAGRLYVAFEAYGSPRGFDFYAERAGTTYEMGEPAPVGATLRVARPEIFGGYEGADAAGIRLRLLRAAEGGAVELASAERGDLTHEGAEAGAYRVEVRITPHHAAPYLGRSAGDLMREVTWILSGFLVVAGPG